MSGRDDPGTAGGAALPRRVLFVIPRMGGGGAERVVSLLANSLAEAGDDVTLYTFVGGESFYPLHSRVRYKTAGAMVSRRNRALRALSELAFLGRTVLALRREILTGGYDVVIPFLREADVLVGVCRLLGGRFRYICSERNDPARRGYLQAKLLDRVYRSADRFVCQSRAVFDHYTCIPAYKKVVIPNPVSDISAEAGTAEKSKRVAAVGRLTEQKNFALLIRSFARVHAHCPDYRLDIYGDGPLRDSLQALIESYGASGYIALRRPEHDIHRAIAGAEVFVLSSDYEGFPNVLLEAMALGLPVISTDFPTGVARELITEENGIVVPVNDVGAMTAAIERLLKDGALRRRMGESGRQRVKQYSAERVLRQWDRTIAQTQL